MSESFWKSDKKIEKLKLIDPIFLDVSLRESKVGASLGQTLSEKLNLFPKLRGFGLENICLGCLNYSMPDEMQVDDDFMITLRDRGEDLTGCFAFIDIGSYGQSGEFVPSVSMEKLKTYGVPNAIVEFSLSVDGRGDKWSIKDVLKSIPESVRWLNENICVAKAKPRIILNIVDGFDVFSENQQCVLELLKVCNSLSVEALSIEDNRGTYFPFQVAEYVSFVRQNLKSQISVLVHFHASAGVENASMIEALLNGADGAWGALSKSAAVNGHASLAELIANLVRVNNENMNKYKLSQLIPLAREFEYQDKYGQISESLPIIGLNAYKLPLSIFQQVETRFMDLAPEKIGGKLEFRICPTVSDPVVIAKRLSEVMQKSFEEFPIEITEKMIRLMRRDLRAGKKIRYDDPSHLIDLYHRALDFFSPNSHL